MERVTRWTAAAAVATAVAAAAVEVLLAARGPVDARGWLVCVTGVVYLPVVLVGAALVRTHRRNPVSWLFLVSGIAVPLSGTFGAAAAVVAVRGGADPAALTVVANAFEAVGIFPLATVGILLFPHGRLAGTGQRALALLFAVQLVIIWLWTTFSRDNFSPVPGVENPIGARGPIGELVESGVVAVLLVGPAAAAAAWSLLRRARRAAEPVRRGLTLAAVAGFVVAAAYAGCVVVGFSGGDTADVGVLENLAAMTVGIAAWVGIVRHGLYDTRVVLSRAVTYGALLVIVTAVYLVAAAAVRSLLDGITTEALASAVAVVVALPLREVLARWVRTRVHGLRDEPVTAFARLGERLTAVGAPDDVLPAAARTVAEVLRLPYVAIEVAGRELAVAGAQRAAGTTERIALQAGEETIGTLLIQHADERQHVRDRELLDTLTRQVAVAARAVALATDLQQHREQLVTLREDERRRIRRELHDGLGPTLAGIALGIDTVARDGATLSHSATLLHDLRTVTEDAVGEIRRIAYGLRPPVLDELGLAAALREQAARLGTASVDVDPALPPLPAAVEVAAYRIAVEAMANAARHAPAATVEVTVRARGALELEIADDGPGIRAGFAAGVGITSMRERATELGGQLTIRPGCPGTVVTAVLPIGAGA